MILPLNGHYRLAADSHCWILQERRTRKRNGKPCEEWRAIKWYTTLEQAVNGYAEFALRVSDAKTLAEALAEVRLISATLCQALSPVLMPVAVRDDAECLPATPGAAKALQQAEVRA